MATSKRKLKHFKLEKVVRGGRDNWRLLWADHEGFEREDPYFSAYAETLSGEALATRRAYTGDVARFLDYLVEGAEYSKKNGANEMSGALLLRLIRKYPQLLYEGKESEDSMILAVAKELNAGPVGHKTQGRAVAAINLYLQESNQFNIDMRDAGNTDANGIPLYSEEDLFPSKKVELKAGEQIAINRKSVLGGVISGGAKFRQIYTLSVYGRDRSADESTILSAYDLLAGDDSEENYSKGKHFPLHLIPKLIINGFLSWRDKALFCLLAACGCRLHEALLLTSLDIRNHQVMLINPRSKSLEDFAGYFRSKREIDALPWKGRSTARTALIEPYKSYFWHFLARYMASDEFVYTNDHNFIFRVTQGENEGSPVITSNYHSNLLKSLHAACDRIGIPWKGIHSLRHSYGIYCYNFLPFDDGTRGMKLIDVKRLMGHATLATTEQYALPDAELNMLRQKLDFAMLQDFSVDTGPKARLEMLMTDMDRIRAQIDREEKAMKALAKKKQGEGKEGGLLDVS